MKAEIEIPEGKRAEWQTINGIMQLVLVDDNPTNPIDGWQDTDIYPVWKDNNKSHTLENLDGIHVPCLDGSGFLYYPKRATLPLMSDDKNADKIEKQHPFYLTTDQHSLTTQWFNAGSEAAKFVRSFGNDKCLPTILQLISIDLYTEKIDSLANILGGDLIKDDDIVHRWSCCRYSSNYAWYYSSSGICSINGFYYSFRVAVVSAFTIN